MTIDIRYLTRLPVDMAHGLKYVTPLVIHVQGRGLNESFQRLNNAMILVLFYPQFHIEVILYVVPIVAGEAQLDLFELH